LFFALLLTYFQNSSSNKASLQSTEIESKINENASVERESNVHMNDAKKSGEHNEDENLESERIGVNREKHNKNGEMEQEGDESRIWRDESEEEGSEERQRGRDGEEEACASGQVEEGRGETELSTKVLVLDKQREIEERKRMMKVSQLHLIGSVPSIVPPLPLGLNSHTFISMNLNIILLPSLPIYSLCPLSFLYLLTSLPLI
jgi:hypothetical protein